MSRRHQRLFGAVGRLEQGPGSGRRPWETPHKQDREPITGCLVLTLNRKNINVAYQRGELTCLLIIACSKMLSLATYLMVAWKYLASTSTSTIIRPNRGDC